MLSLDEALGRVLATAAPLPAAAVSVAEAYGRVLAEDVLAPSDLPAYDYSAMDGYAVHSGDFAGSGPWQLPLRGESRAGHPAPVFERGSVCRIFTGAPLPEGADAVVMQENVERSGELVRFSRSVSSGEHVRRRGEDLQRGSAALRRGRRLGAFELGLATALDQTELRVSARPAVSIVSTGDELRAAGTAGPPGSIPESNGIVIATLARAVGGEVRSLDCIGDERALLQGALQRAAESSDVVVTIGGASVGDHDHVLQALAAAGAQVDFWKVRIKPGKPFLLGSLGRARVIGLPGNPVSAQLTFVLFGLPLLRALQGESQPVPPRMRVKLGSELRQKAGRLGLYRARLDGDVALLQSNQASGSSASLADADVVVVIPETSEGAAAGELVEAIRLPRP